MLYISYLKLLEFGWVWYLNFKMRQKYVLKSECWTWQLYPHFILGLLEILNSLVIFSVKYPYNGRNIELKMYYVKMLFLGIALFL